MFKLKGLNYLSKVHLPQLDGLRGLAIILVFFNHLFTFLPGAILGWVGVDLFFVLSGFLITGILLETKEKKGYYLNFVKKRALRIFPLYYFFLIVFFILYPLSGANFIPYYQSLYNIQGWFWSYLSNFYFAFKGWPPNQLLDHFWSLSIEEQFYLFWPLIVLKFNTKAVVGISAVLIGISILVRNVNTHDPFPTTFTFARLDGLSIGAIIAIFIRVKKEYVEKYTIPIMLSSLLMLLTIIFCTRNLLTTNIYFVRIGFTLFDVFFGCLLITSLDKYFLKGIISKILSTPFFRFFGKYSYGLYVYHFPLYHLLYPYLTSKLKSFQLGKFYSNLLATSELILIIILISLLSYHFIEKPFLALKNKI